MASDAVAVVLGSAFSEGGLVGLALQPVGIDTRFGKVILHAAPNGRGRGWVLFRHGRPHRLLPNQIPYRAHAAALSEVGCGALVVTSSVGVLDASLPLFRPLLVADLLMPENRLPDGSACTMFDAPAAGQGHLVLTEGLFSRGLGEQVRRLAAETGEPVAGDVVFGYVGGPRTKTRAENRLWARLGAQVNSMTLGPEVVLANELGIPCAGLVMGHKYSAEGVDTPDEKGIEDSLETSRGAMERIVAAFLERGEPVSFANRIYRFGGERT